MFFLNRVAWAWVVNWRKTWENLPSLSIKNQQLHFERIMASKPVEAEPTGQIPADYHDTFKGKACYIGTSFCRSS